MLFMTKLETLEEKAINLNIRVDNCNFSETKKGACFRMGDYKAILLNHSKIKSASEKAVILAHELGHYETGSLFLIEATANTPVAHSNRRKYEAKATKWAIEELLPTDKLEEIINKRYDEHEIAEHFGVTLDFLHEAFEFYKTKGIVFGDGGE